MVAQRFQKKKVVSPVATEHNLAPARSPFGKSSDKTSNSGCVSRWLPARLSCLDRSLWVLDAAASIEPKRRSSQNPIFR
jgi:hypothetical protein